MRTRWVHSQRPDLGSKSEKNHIYYIYIYNIYIIIYNIIYILYIYIIYIIYHIILYDFKPKTWSMRMSSRLLAWPSWIWQTWFERLLSDEVTLNNYKNYCIKPIMKIKELIYNFSFCYSDPILIYFFCNQLSFELIILLIQLKKNKWALIKLWVRRGSNVAEDSNTILSHNVIKNDVINDRNLPLQAW